VRRCPPDAEPAPTMVVPPANEENQVWDVLFEFAMTFPASDETLNICLRQHRPRTKSKVHLQVSPTWQFPGGGRDRATVLGLETRPVAAKGLSANRRLAHAGPARQHLLNSSPAFTMAEEFSQHLPGFPLRGAAVTGRQANSCRASPEWKNSSRSL